MTTNKNWGTNTLIYSDHNIEVHRACINKNGTSSKHYHEHKYNLFYVESGYLIVKIWENNSDYKEVFLHEGDRLVVQPKKWHKFLAIEPCSLIEIYYTSISLNDIIREK